MLLSPVDRGESGEPSTAGPRAGPAAAAAGAWGALILAAHLHGAALLRDGVALHLPAPPLYAAFDPGVGPRFVPAVLAAGGLVAAAGRADRLPWRTVPLAAALAAAGWAVALAFAGEPGSLAAPLLDPHDYLHDVPLVASPHELLSGFTEGIDRYTTHVRSHPPGMLLLAWSLAQAGAGSAAVLAGIIVAVGASAAAAALVALADVAGEKAARRAAPFVAVAPAALWTATSADALFAGVGAWGVALTVLATGDRPRAALAVAGGVLLGAAVFLSYGLVLLAAIPVAVAAARRRPAPLAVAGIGVAAVAVAFASQGFLWWEGLEATRIQYRAGAASGRPYGYFLLAGAAALAVALGPACAAALARLRDRRVWLLAGPALVAVAAAALSGLSKGEVERIWLPFMPWLLVATAALPPAGALAGRGWLAAQAATALAVEALLVLPW